MLLNLFHQALGQKKLVKNIKYYEKNFQKSSSLKIIDYI